MAARSGTLVHGVPGRGTGTEESALVDSGSRTRARPLPRGGRRRPGRHPVPRPGRRALGHVGRGLGSGHERVGGGRGGRDPRPSGSCSIPSALTAVFRFEPGGDDSRSRGAPPCASRPLHGRTTERPRPRSSAWAARGGRDRARGRRRARRAPARRGDDRRRALPPARGDRRSTSARSRPGRSTSRSPDGVEATAGWFRPVRLELHELPAQAPFPVFVPATCRTAGGWHESLLVRARAPAGGDDRSASSTAPGRRVGRHRARARGRRASRTSGSPGRGTTGSSAPTRARTSSRATMSGSSATGRGSSSRAGCGAARAARAAPSCRPPRAAEAPERVRARSRGPSSGDVGGPAATRRGTPRARRSSSSCPSASAGAASARSGSGRRGPVLRAMPGSRNGLRREAHRVDDLHEPVAGEVLAGLLEGLDRRPGRRHAVDVVHVVRVRARRELLHHLAVELHRRVVRPLRVGRVLEEDDRDRSVRRPCSCRPRRRAS